MSDPRSEIRDAFKRRIDAAPMAPDLPWRAVEHAAGRSQRRSLRFATLAAAALAVLVVATLIFVSTARQQPHGSVPAGGGTASPSHPPSPPPTPSPVFTEYSLPDRN